MNKSIFKIAIVMAIIGLFVIACAPAAQPQAPAPPGSNYRTAVYCCAGHLRDHGARRRHQVRWSGDCRPWARTGPLLAAV